MSLPGVESARWRRASHGKSSSAPSTCRSSSARFRTFRYNGYTARTRQTADLTTGAGDFGDRTELNLDVTALLARDRLHERLWGRRINPNAAPYQTTTMSTSSCLHVSQKCDIISCCGQRPETTSLVKPSVSSNAPGKQPNSRGFPLSSIRTLVCNKHS